MKMNIEKNRKLIEIMSRLQKEYKESYDEKDFRIFFTTKTEDKNISLITYIISNKTKTKKQILEQFSWDEQTEKFKNIYRRDNENRI